MTRFQMPSSAFDFAVARRIAADHSELTRGKTYFFYPWADRIRDLREDFPSDESVYEAFVAELKAATVPAARRVTR